MLKELIQQINNAPTSAEQINSYFELNDYLSFYNDEDITCEYLPAENTQEKIKVELNDNPDFIITVDYTCDFHVIKNIVGVNVMVINGDVYE